MALLVPGTCFGAEPAAGGNPAKPRNPLNGLRAFRYLEQLCDLGPRPSGSEAMQKQQELVREALAKLAATAPSKN